MRGFLVNKSEWKPFVKLMATVAEEIGAKEKSAAGLSLTFKLLSNYSLDQVTAAIYQFLLSSEAKYGKVPSAAQIIEQIQGSDAERAHYAWRYFLAAMTKRGYYDSVRFPEPAYHYAIQLLGGWQRICEEYGDLTDKELEFRRGAFVSLYLKGVRESSFEPIPGKVQVRPYLAGFYETSNMSSGYGEFLPPIYEIETEQGITRDTLKLQSGGQMMRLVEGIGKDKEIQ